MPQLQQLDANDITHSERLEALQELPELLEQLKVVVRDGLFQKPTSYTKEARIEMARENERIQEEKDREKKKDDDKAYGNGYVGVKNAPPPPVYNEKGDVRQCNQGSYEYSFFEKNEKNRQFIILEVGVPRYLDTSKIDVDLNPTYVRICIKKKVLQLTFPCEIIVDESQAKRSQTTGSLQLIMPKFKKTIVPYFYLKEELEEQKEKEKRQGMKKVEEKKNEGSDIGGKEEREEREEPPKSKSLENEAWEDDSDVPPLE